MSDTEVTFCPVCERSYDGGIEFCPHDGSSLVSRTNDEMVGKILDGRFQIIHKLGEGGMGAVYKARQISTGKLVAIKVISASLSDNADTQERFRREVKLQSKLEHPGIVTVIDFSRTDEGQYFFVMGFVEGLSLRRFIKEKGPTDIQLFKNLALQMVDALHYSHNLGIVHRDLKADNMIVVTLEHQQILKILDFGLAKAFHGETMAGGDQLTQEGRILGTPAYMAPEQAKGEIHKIGPPCDIYALGVIFYQMLTGKLPFASDTPWGVLHKQINDTPEPIRMLSKNVPAWIENIVDKCMEKEIEDRFGNLLELRKALIDEDKGAFDNIEGGTLDFAPTLDIPDTGAKGEVVPPPIPEKPGQKKSGTTGIIAIVLIVLVAVGMGYFALSEKPETPDVEEVKISKEPAVKSVVPTEEKKAEPEVEIEPVVKSVEKKAEDKKVEATKPAAIKPPTEKEPITKPAAIKPATGAIKVVTKPVAVKPATAGAIKASAMFRGGALRTGRSAGKGPAKFGSVKWKFETDDWIFSSPVISGDKIFFGNDAGIFYALDKNRGTKQWTFTAGSAISSSPLVAGDKVYIGTKEGMFYALAKSNGRPQWSFNAGSNIFSSPLMQDNKIYFGTEKGDFYAISALTGKQAWQKKIGWQIDSSPAGKNGVVYFGAFDGIVYALDGATGRQVWKKSTGKAIGSSPAIDGDRLYIGSDDEHLYAISLKDGKELWKAKADDWVRSSPAVADGKVFVGDKAGVMRAFDTKNGKELWKISTGDAILSSPTVADSVLYFGSDDGSLYAVTTAGKTLFEYETENGIFSSPVVDDGILYFGGYDQTFYAISEVK